MLCDRCGKNPPVIHISGEGSYCADCNNQMMLELFGKDNTFHYAKNIIINETDGKMHSGLSVAAEQAGQSAGIDPELLMKVLTNPEMAKLLKALAGTIE